MSTNDPTADRIVLTFSPLPQDAWSEERDVSQDAFVLKALRLWGDHLARAIRTADRLHDLGWRLRLDGDMVVAEKRAGHEELAALARALRTDLRALTATAQSDNGAEDEFLALEDGELRQLNGKGFSPLIEG